jgi:hypothetical protein
MNKKPTQFVVKMNLTIKLPEWMVHQLERERFGMLVIEDIEKIIIEKYPSITVRWDLNSKKFK